MKIGILKEVITKEVVRKGYKKSVETWGRRLRVIGGDFKPYKRSIQLALFGWRIR